MKAALVDLRNKGFFCQERALHKSGMLGVGSAIRWDYLREFIQDDEDIELIPLVGAFFKLKDATQVQKGKDNPERYIAGGDGGKTAGYAAVIEQNKHFVITHIEQKDRALNGVRDSVKAFTAKAKSRVPSLTPDDTPALAPPQTLGQHMDATIDSVKSD